jgi:hypothetical protein
MASLEKQHDATKGAIEMLKQSLVPIPENIKQMSDQMATVISLLSDLSRPSAEMQHISSRVENLHMTSKGIS